MKPLKFFLCSHQLSHELTPISFTRNTFNNCTLIHPSIHSANTVWEFTEIIMACKNRHDPYILMGGFNFCGDKEKQFDQKMCNYSCATAMKARCRRAQEAPVGTRTGFLEEVMAGLRSEGREALTKQRGWAERGAQVFLAPVPTASFQQERALPLNALSFTWWLGDVGNIVCFSRSIVVQCPLTSGPSILHEVTWSPLCL